MNLIKKYRLGKIHLLASLYVHHLNQRGIIDRQALTKKCDTIEYFGSEEIIEIDGEFRSQELPKDFQDILGDHHIPSPFICEMSNCELVGPDAIGLANTGEIISETAVYHKNHVRLERSISDTIRDLVKNKKITFKKNGHEDVGFSMVNHWSDGYFHWVAENLTRLEGFEYYRKKTGNDPTIFIPNPSPDWLIEWMDLLGYEDYVTPWPGGRVSVDKLIIPNFRWVVGPGIISPTPCRWLRDQVLNNISPPEGDRDVYSTRIYISREDADRRRIRNESELMDELSTFGFQKYILSDLTVPEQIYLFSQADSIVAPHGAGLINMIWGKNIDIIEIFGEHINTCYFSIAKALNFSYKPIFSESKDQDIFANVAEITDAVIRSIT